MIVPLLVLVLVQMERATKSKRFQISLVIGYRLRSNGRALLDQSFTFRNRARRGQVVNKLDVRSIAPILSSFCLLCRSRFSPQPRPVRERMHCRIVHGT